MTIGPSIRLPKQGVKFPNEEKCRTLHPRISSGRTDFQTLNNTRQFFYYRIRLFKIEII